MNNGMSIKKAAILMGIAKYTNVITTLLFSAILARLLTPSDYGIMAVTTVFTSFFALLTDMGIGTGVIQNKTLTKEEISHIFNITFYFGIVLGIVFCLLGYPMSLFYRNSVYISICCILSLSLIFNALNMIPNAILMKEQEFSKVTVRNIIVPIITNIVAIILAFIGFKYYALAVQSVIAAFMTFLWNYQTVRKMQPLRLTTKINFTGFNKIRSYSGYQFSFSIVNYFSRNLDNLLTSKFLGETLLGYYDKAYKLMLYPLNMLTSVITPVLHPILSQYQNDTMYIYDQYIKILKILSLCGMFIVPFCFVSSYEIIYIMFGENWMLAVPCFQVLSLSVWCQLLTSSTGAIFQSTNNTKLMLKSALINTAITVITIFAGISTGKIENMALGVSLAYIINYLITFGILIKYVFKLSFFSFNKVLMFDFIYMIFILIVVCLITKFIVVSNVFLSIVMKGTLVLLFYVVYLLISEKYKILLNLIRGK